VSALSTSDAEGLLRFVAEVDGLGSEHPFTGDLLDELGHLIQADWVTYTEVDHVRRRSLLYLPRPGDDEEEDEIGDDDWELMHEHPVCRRWRKQGRFGALRLSDTVDPRELRRSRFYDLALRPWGIEHELKTRLLSPPWHARTFALHRKAGRDFTDRDRLVLELLTPHLERMWQAAQTRRLLHTALRELERVDEDDLHGVVLLGPQNEIEFASPPARRMLVAFFPGTTFGLLPAAVLEWLDSGARRPLLQACGDQELSIERSGDALLLRAAEQPEVELTRREREVLAWVARGKTNAEIAELLWLAPSTVRKHLENVYAKLGVSTRTAAVARFLGLIDTQAS
jgi:DNA-binding CsgD family transcriptional regulator